MSGKYDLRAGYIIDPPLLSELDPNVFLSDKIMNGGTGVWGKDISYTLYRDKPTKMIDAYDFEYMKGGA